MSESPLNQATDNRGCAASPEASPISAGAGFHDRPAADPNAAPDAQFARRLLEAKLAALAEFAAGAGHEINNPLATIAGRVQLLLRDETDPERRQALLTIGGQAYRIRDMIGDAMLFARPPTPALQTLDLAAELRSALGRFEDQAAERGCAFSLDAAEPVPILADRTQLAVVISELVRNSLRAIESVDEPRRSPIVRVAARAIRQDDRPFAQLAIADDGGGLSEEEREHLFDPFFSGRQAGRGLGFGLSKAWRIVTQHGGTIEVVANPGEETRFEVLWPAEPSPGGLRSAPGQIAAPERSKSGPAGENGGFTSR